MGQTVDAASPADLERLLALWAAAFPGQPAPDLARALDEGRAVVLRGPDGVTAAALSSSVDARPRERRLTLLAADLGSWLHAERAATAPGGRLGAGVDYWHVTVREDAALSLEGVRRAGYALASRSWGARLDVDDDDLPVLHRRAQAALGRGLRLHRLDRADAGPAHRLLRSCRADFPATPATPPPDHDLDDVVAALTGPGRVGYGATASAAAGGGGRLVAVTLLEVDEDGRSADTDLTAVAADQRGRGVATALKAFAVVDLASRGVRTFRTGGAEVNEASLRANRRLGYRVEPLWLTWSRPAG